MKKIVKSDVGKLVQKIVYIAFVGVFENWNSFLSLRGVELKPVTRSTIAKFATKYEPFDVKIVNLYRTIAIKSKLFNTTAPTTIAEISGQV